MEEFEIGATIEPFTPIPPELDGAATRVKGGIITVASTLASTLAPTGQSVRQNIHDALNKSAADRNRLQEYLNATTTGEPIEDKANPTAITTGVPIKGNVTTTKPAAQLSALARELETMKQRVEQLSGQPENGIQEMLGQPQNDIQEMRGYVDRTRQAVLSDVWRAELEECRLDHHRTGQDEQVVAWASNRWYRNYMGVFFGFWRNEARAMTRSDRARRRSQRWMDSRMMRRGLETWMQARRTDKLLDNAAHLFAHWDLGACQQGWRTWRDGTLESLRLEQQVHWAVIHWYESTVAAGFNTWRAFRSAEPLDTILHSVVLRWKHRLLGAAWNRWRSVWQHARYQVCSSFAIVCV